MFRDENVESVTFHQPLSRFVTFSLYDSPSSVLASLWVKSRTEKEIVHSTNGKMEPHAEHFTPHYFDDPLSQCVQLLLWLQLAFMNVMYYISLLISIRVRPRFLIKLDMKSCMHLVEISIFH